MGLARAVLCLAGNADLLLGVDDARGGQVQPVD